MQQAFINMRSGRPAKLQPPKADYLQGLGPQEHALLATVRESYAIGSPATVRREMQAFIDRTGADELMIAGQIFDHAARLRSYEIAAEVAGLVQATASPASQVNQFERIAQAA
jgi:alkanesulfonate monooxygenase SsuD/methylene tetrahydromethanopterin reductase-like flavin-dependent oxidoreductase (luciferase family)